MTKTKAPELFFQLTHKVDGTHGTFDLHLVQESDTPQFGRFQTAEQPGSWSSNNAYSDLVVHAQWNQEDENARLYAFDVEYRNPYVVELPRAEAMVKLLRKIKRKLDKMRDELGSTDRFADYLRRVALALGIKRAVEHNQFSGWSEPFDLDVLASKMDKVVRESLRNPAAPRSLV